jgi:two-component system, NarL family, sensor histidine kinase DegS
VTDALLIMAVAERPLLVRVATLIRNLPHRIREREFWVVQAGVLTVTGVHIAAELLADLTGLDTPTAFHHIPVLLYLAPISYASLRFGTEGAVLTGLWSATLTVPNLLIWHQTDFEWLEIIYVAVVIVAGVIMSLPVERERLERRRVEATSQRLALLDHIATLTLTADLKTTLNETLDRLVNMLQLEAACVAVSDPALPGSAPSVLAAHPNRDRTGEMLLGALGGTVQAAAPVTEGPGVVVVPMTGDLLESESESRVSGFLAVKIDPGRPLGADDHQLLAGVASHLAIAIANERLEESERNRLRSYAALMTQAQEEERKRIARELHDEAAQNVVVIRRSLATFAANYDDHPAAHELSDLSDLAGQTLEGIRRFSRDLRPPTLDELGLSSALEQLVAEVRERTEMATEVRVAGSSRRLPIETELALFRIGQAALHNVEIHAGAESALIELTFQPNRVRMVITDDGSGFDPPRDLSALPTTGKLGLIGMNERAQLIGATLEIQSRPGAGTHVTLDVPA